MQTLHYVLRGLSWARFYDKTLSGIGNGYLIKFSAVQELVDKRQNIMQIPLHAEASSHKLFGDNHDDTVALNIAKN